MNRPDFRILEGIRGLAAFIVVLNHARGYFFVGGRSYLASHSSVWDKLAIGMFQITSLGLDAVIVFFVLSGFSIAHSVASGGSASRFYARRIVRLAPPAVAGLALAWLAQRVATPQLDFERYIPQYWSLYHEAIFYALAPVIVAAVWRLHFAAAAAVGYVAGVLLGDGNTPHNFVFQYAFYFAVGVLAYHHTERLTQLVMPKRALVLACIGAFGVTAATVQTSPRASALLAAAFALLLIANFQHHRITNRPLQLLGAMSYTLYVTHFATIVLWSEWLQRVGFVQGRATASLWLWMTSVPVCLLVSITCYWLIERPAMQQLKRMRGSRVAVLPLMQLDGDAPKPGEGH